MTAAYASYAERVLRRREDPVDVYATQLYQAVEVEDRVLHLGCGWDRSNVTRPMAGLVDVVGVDMDREAGMRYHSPYWRADARNLPFADNSFALACSEWVFEHLDDPAAVLQELSRVLKPGGRVFALTPNAWSYKVLAARLTPHAFHAWAAANLRSDPRSSEDVYPTRYLANTRGSIEKLADAHGFDVRDCSFLNNGPTWFAKIPILFELGRLGHAALDSPLLARLRCCIVIELQKRGQAAAEAQTSHPRPLAIRCTQCGCQQMASSVDGHLCPACGHHYAAVHGRVMETFPIAAAISV